MIRKNIVRDFYFARSGVAQSVRSLDFLYKK